MLFELYAILNAFSFILCKEYLNSFKTKVKESKIKCFIQKQ